MKEQKLSFDCSLNDKILIGKIVQRATEMASQAGVKEGIDFMTLAMDITACHCNGTPIKLLQLLMSSPEDFSHDVTGIGRFIDRNTARLMNDFQLRFAENKH